MGVMMSIFLIPSIETERLLLRQATVGDIETWANLIFSDPDMLRYLPKRDMTPLERAQRAFDFDQRTWEEHKLAGWIVTDKATGAFIGNCYFEIEETDEYELGYNVAKAYWGKGFATEASRAIVRYAFETRKLERIIAMAIPENIGSSRVLEKVGFVFEKQAFYYNLDVWFYSITREQFQIDDSLYIKHEMT
jgi:ribosomal-protein-alanine N-acetyltransferase